LGCDFVFAFAFGHAIWERKPYAINSTAKYRARAETLSMTRTQSIRQ
jgi:hypothetical protein